MRNTFWSLFHRVFGFGAASKTQNTVKQIEQDWPEGIKITPLGKIYITEYPSSLTDDDILAELKKSEPETPEDPRLVELSREIDQLRRKMQQKPRTKTRTPKLDLIFR